MQSGGDSGTAAALGGFVPQPWAAGEGRDPGRGAAGGTGSRLPSGTAHEEQKLPEAASPRSGLKTQMGGRGPARVRRGLEPGPGAPRSSRNCLHTSVDDRQEWRQSRAKLVQTRNEHSGNAPAPSAPGPPAEQP